jgi:UDP-N-acetylglucosamine--N-acetylmuramyl-(pentapeptide) pyrophosphoryl-undecaprenol N-acetylglucosamine transferase
MASPVEALFVGEADGMERGLAQRDGIPFEAIQAGAVAGVGVFGALKGLFKIMIGTTQALNIVSRYKPDAVLLTGGFVGVPVALAAALRGVPSVAYLPDIEPGLAFKVMARLVTKVAATAEASSAYIDRRKLVVTGYPLREVFASATRQAGRMRFGIDATDRVLLVFGGSKGARQINEAIGAAAPELLKRCVILHVTGTANRDAVNAIREAVPADLRARWQVHAYLHDEMAEAMAAADLAVCRSGASVLGELPATQLPAVLVPYPWAWRYQKVNAAWLVDRGAAVLMPDGELAARLAETVIGLLDDNTRLAAMRASAGQLAIPDGAARIATVVKDIIHD